MICYSYSKSCSQNIKCLGDKMVVLRLILQKYKTWNILSLKTFVKAGRFYYIFGVPFVHQVSPTLHGVKHILNLVKYGEHFYLHTSAHLQHVFEQKSRKASFIFLADWTCFKFTKNYSFVNP